MKRAKPNWNLASRLVPSMILSLTFVIFFPTFTFQILLAILVITFVVGSWHGLQKINHRIAVDKKNTVIQSTLSIVGLIFLLGISIILILFFTATSQLAPEVLALGKIRHIWLVTFPVGMMFLLAQMWMHFFQIKKPNALRVKLDKKIGRKKTEKLLLTIQQFTGFSTFVVLVISFMMVVMMLASAFMHAVHFEMPIGLQLQTIIACTLLYLPWTMKWFNQDLKLKESKVSIKKVIKVLGVLVFLVIVLSFLTLPFVGMPIQLGWIQYGLTEAQWKLFILAWWIGITPLVATKIIQNSQGRTLLQQVLAVIISAGIVYGFGLWFLAMVGEYWLLAFIHENASIVLLSVIPIAALALNLLRFKQPTEMVFSQPDPEKHARHEKYFMQSLIKGIVITCALYWISGLSILSLFLLMVAIPWVVLFLGMESFSYYKL